MLMDGAIDQTFAFNRTTFVQLTAAKIELTDKLATQVPDSNMFMLQAIATTARALGVGP